MATEFVMDQCCDCELLNESPLDCSLLLGQNYMDEYSFGGEDARFFFNFGMQAQDIDIRPAFMELRRYHGFTGYLLELLNEGPIYMYLPEDYVSFAEMNEEYYCGEPDCMEIPEKDAMDLHWQSLSGLIPQYARSRRGGKVAVPEGWQELVKRYEGALAVCRERSDTEQSYRDMDDVPYIFLKWGDRDEWNRLQDDLLQWSGEMGESQMSPFAVFLRQTAEETARILRGVMQAAECQLEIVQKLSLTGNFL